MKRNLVAVISVVLLVMLFRGTIDTPALKLEIYRQAGEGSVELMGVVTKESVIREYDLLYDKMEFMYTLDFIDYPDAAVYRSDGTGVRHHSNIWFSENGEGYMQQMTGDRKSAPLSVEDTLLLKEILQQQQPVRSE
jgi:hypothetical protein